MVKLNKIYTRTGDTGSAGLVDGSRVSKASARMAAIGDVDEANASVGMAIILLDDESLGRQLRRIQNDLFDLGADLCTPESENPKYPPLRITQPQIDRLEHEIDAMNAKMKPLDSFILPGGTPAAAHLHLARTVARRAERLMTELATHERINPLAVAYINRLSDHLFVLARHLNDDGAKDVLWVPGKNR